MMFMIKEMKAHVISKKANMDPYLVGHLNLDTIEVFEFKDPNPSDEERKLQENVSLDALIMKSIKLAKEANIQSKTKQEQKVMSEFGNNSVLKEKKLK